MGDPFADAEAEQTNFFSNRIFSGYVYADVAPYYEYTGPKNPIPCVMLNTTSETICEYYILVPQLHMYIARSGHIMPSSSTIFKQKYGTTRIMHQLCGTLPELDVHMIDLLKTADVNRASALFSKQHITEENTSMEIDKFECKAMHYEQRYNNDVERIKKILETTFEKVAAMKLY